MILFMGTGTMGAMGATAPWEKFHRGIAPW